MSESGGDPFSKPRCLGPDYAAQFQDEAVAAAYHGRPPYPEELFTFVGGLQPKGPGRVLELGCGTGDLTIWLAGHVGHIDAVEPSQAMLRVARARPGGGSDRITWHEAYAEDFAISEPYDLVVAAESLHWMDWSVVIPKIAAALAPGAFLAVAGRSRILPEGIGSAVSKLIAQYSTNRDYEPYDAVRMLTERGLFEEVGRERFEGSFEQPVDVYIEGIHSQNGFSRDRMSPEASAEFDAAVHEIAAPYASNGVLHVGVDGVVVWGRVTGV